MLKYLPNMAACHISIAHDARGPNNSIVEGGVSSLLAIGEASAAIERGHADAMLAGGSGWEPFRSQITSPLVASMMIAARAVRRGLEAFAAVAGTIATSKAHASHCVRDTVIRLLAPAEAESAQ